MSDQFLLPDLINPRLEFGVSLDKVCERGILHPGLRELFLKAYLSASAGDECPGKEPFKGLSRPPYVLEALRAGPEGQGRLVDRMSLKLRLESGKWIIATQTPAGTPLWLLRHYLGCLPEPLLHGSYWGEIAITCGSALCLKSNNYNSEILKQIVTALKSLPRENYSTLETLVLLIRNLSTAIPTNNSAAAITLNEEALEALSVYFTAAIISRPYRPGLYTTILNKQFCRLAWLRNQLTDLVQIRYLQFSYKCRENFILIFTHLQN